MFPNPQDALPLPRHPSLEQYKKLAKDLVKACKSGDAGAIHRWASSWVASLVSLCQETLTPFRRDPSERWISDVAAFATHKFSGAPGGCTLTASQFVIARSHGFESWPKFAEHLRALARSSPVSSFEAAADAIVAGDAAGLRQLLAQHPDLVRQCSTREHRATLLHYCSANGIESYRQKTPANIVEIATMLLDAGADVDAPADVYGGHCTTLGLAATSVHPEKAGVQAGLLQLLLDRGAAPAAPAIAGRRDSLIRACLANGRARAAGFLAERGVPLDFETAAGVGKLASVQSFFDADGRLRPPASQEQLQRGFVWACAGGHDDVVAFLLQRGADLRDDAGSGEPPLHMAVVGARLSTLKLLIARGAPLEQRNRYNGTALGQAGWSFVNGDPDADYVPLFEALLAAGASIEPGWLQWLDRQKAPSAAAKASVAELLRRYGAAS